MVNGAGRLAIYTPGMEGTVSAIILIMAFAGLASWCAVLMLKLWRAGYASPRPPREPQV
jgi:hypothetical protein